MPVWKSPVLVDTEINHSSPHWWVSAHQNPAHRTGCDQRITKENRSPDPRIPLHTPTAIKILKKTVPKPVGII